MLILSNFIFILHYISKGNIAPFLFLFLMFLGISKPYYRQKKEDKENGHFNPWSMPNIIKYLNIVYVYHLSDSCSFQ